MAAVAGGAVAGALACLFQQLGRVLALPRTTRLVAVVGRGSRQRRTCAIAHDAVSATVQQASRELSGALQVGLPLHWSLLHLPSVAIQTSK